MMDGSLELEKMFKEEKRAGPRAYNELVECILVTMRVQSTAWLC